MHNVKIKKTTAFALVSERIKYLRINLAEVYNSYTENYKRLLKEIKEDLD